MPDAISSCEASPRPAAASPWRRIFHDTAWVSGSTLVGQAFGAVTSLLLRALLDPAQIGLWQGVRLMVNYGNLSNLGVSRGASREMTIALGRGDETAAQRSANLAFTVNTLASLVCGGLLLAVGMLTAVSQPTPAGRAWGAALAVAGVLCVAQRFLTYQVTVLRARQRFALTASITVMESALTLAICGALVACWGLPGLYLGSIAVGILCAAFVVLRGEARLQLAWDRGEIRRLLAIGFPIMLAALANQLFRSLDRLTILALAPDREVQLGLYSVALLATGQMFGLANALATVMGPRYGETLGRTGQTHGVAALAATASGPQAVLLSIVGALALVLGSPLLATLLPEYRAGLAGMGWLVAGTVALGVALPASQYLITIDRQHTLLRIVLLSTVLGATANLIALGTGWGLSGLAAATCAAQVVYAALVIRYSFWTELAEAQQRRYLEQVVLPSCIVLGCAAALAVDPSVPMVWTSVLMRTVLMLFVGIAAAAYVWPRNRPDRKAWPQSTEQWRARCYKPGAEQLGNTYARFVARPLALQITRLVAPAGMTANLATGIALALAGIAAGLFACGSVETLVAGAIVLQLWYLLDHVDGQLARLHGTASLDGVQLDYLMHHLVHLLVPLGLGWGAFYASGLSLWLAAGLIWGLALLCLGLWHDARYKAFVQRLKWVRGELIVRGAAAHAPAPAAAWPNQPRRVPGYLVRKACEMHVVMNLLSVLPLAAWMCGDQQFLLVRCYLGAMAPTAALLAILVIVRDVRRGEAEQEFATWYRPPAGRVLHQDGAHWRVDPVEESPQPRHARTATARRAS